MFVFDTSHDDLTEVLPGFLVMCYIHKRVVDKEKEKSIWSLRAQSAIFYGVKEGGGRMESLGSLACIFMIISRLKPKRANKVTFNDQNI